MKSKERHSQTVHILAAACGALLGISGCGSNPSAPAPSIAPAPSASPAPVALSRDSRLSAIDATKLRFTILNAGLLKSQIESENELFFTQGELVNVESGKRFREQGLEGAAYCFFRLYSEYAKEGATLIPARQAERSIRKHQKVFRQWTGIIDQDAMITCYNTTDEPMKIHRIQTALKGVVEVSVQGSTLN